MSENKLANSQENPIDIVFIYFSNLLAPLFYALNLTPNILTFISLTTGICSVIALYYNKLYTSAILWTIAYFFDCADGVFARKYDMVTRFGDLFDHISDVTKGTLIILVLFTKIVGIKSKIKFIAISFIFIILSTIHMGCQEKIYDNTDIAPTLKYLPLLCDKKNYIYITRFFGVGTLNLILVLFILFHSKI